MTDEDVADAVYIEPLTPEVIRRVIQRERPDGLLPTLGGQTGLNLAVQVAELGILDRYGVRLLGTQLAVDQDGRGSRSSSRSCSERSASRRSRAPSCTSIDEAHAFAETGAAAARDSAGVHAWRHRRRRRDDAGRARPDRHQRSERQPDPARCCWNARCTGWKEIEYEVMRDGDDTCITICNMENFDPMGVHTGDSIVVAPSQTLSDHEYQMLRIVGAQDHPRARDRRRLQHPVRARSRFVRLFGDRSQSARQPVVGAGIESDRISDRPDGRQDRDRQAARRADQCGHRKDDRRVRAGARLRASSRFRAGRSTSSPRPTARSAPR